MRQGACQCLNISLQVMSDHKARSKRVNDSLKTTHMEAVPNEDIEGVGGRFGGSGVTEKEIPRSVFWGLLQTRKERWRGQMSKVISVRPDKLQLGYQLLLRARGRAGAKTMPTPLCDDQCLRRLCKMAAAMPTH